MKKIVALFLLLTLCITPALGCADPRPSANTAATTMPWEDPSLSESDRKIREVSDPVVMKLYDITDLDDFSIRIIDQSEYSYYKEGEPKYEVRYTITVGGVATEECVEVYVNADLALISSKSHYKTLYSCYLPNVTDEAIENAKQKIEEQAKQYNQSIPYWTGIDEEGYLCIKTELIVPRAPDNPDKSGCGDHDHLFFTERVCLPAITYKRDTLEEPMQFSKAEREIIRLMWIDKKRDAIELFPDVTINTIAEHVQSGFLTPCQNGYVVEDYDFSPSNRRETQNYGGLYEFRVYNGEALLFYQDGKLYRINSAIYYNLITKDDLKGVWEAHKERYPQRYAEAKWETIR